MSAERDSVYCKNTKDNEDDWSNILEMSEKSKEFLKKYIPDALQTAKLEYALQLIDDWVLEYGFDKNWNLNDKGREGEEVYDDVRSCNENNENLKNITIIEMSHKTKQFLRKNIPQALDTTDVNEVLELIENWIIQYGFEGPDDNFTDKGHEGEEAYDDIYYLNP